MEIQGEKICECHNQPISVHFMDKGFKAPDGDRTYQTFPDGSVVQFECKVTNTPCSVVQEAVNEPVIKRKLQEILKKEKVTRKDIQGYLRARGFIRVNDLGWVLEERLGEMIMKGVVKQIDGMYILTQNGIDRFTISSIYRYLAGKSNSLDIQVLTKPVADKKKDSKLLKEIFDGM